MESSILIIGGGVALGAFVLGSILLALYLRSNRAKTGYTNDPMVYGNLVMCPNCGYMNPMDTAACLKCRVPLPARPPQFPPAGQPGYGYPPPPPPGGGPPPPDYGYAPSAPPAPPKPDYSYSPSSPPKPDYAPPPAYGNYAAPSNPYAPDPEQTGAPANPSPGMSAAAAPSVMPGGMPRAWLEGVSGAVMGHRVYLSQISTLVGRSTQCDVQVYDPKVSRRHFQIRYANGGFFLQDQQSSRGTRINGERVMARRLNDGDRIDAGDSSLIFHIEG